MYAGSKYAKFPTLCAKKCLGCGARESICSAKAAIGRRCVGAKNFSRKRRSPTAVSLFACRLFLGCRRVILRGARLLSAFCNPEAKLVPRGACCALQGGAGIIYFGSAARTPL